MQKDIERMERKIWRDLYTERIGHFEKSEKANAGMRYDEPQAFKNGHFNPLQSTSMHFIIFQVSSVKVPRGIRLPYPHQRIQRKLHAFHPLPKSRQDLAHTGGIAGWISSFSH